MVHFIEIRSLIWRKPMNKINDNLFVCIIEIIVGLKTFSFLNVEDGSDLFVGLEREVLHFGVYKGVVVCEGKIVGFGF